MKQGAIALTVAAVVASGPSFAAKPSPPPPPLQPLAFYDAAGQLVGRVAIPGTAVPGQTATIVLPWKTDYVPVFVDNYFLPDGYTREAWFKQYSEVFFAGPGCTGTAYVENLNNPPVLTGLPRRLTAMVGNTLYVSVADTVPASVSFQSVTSGAGGCQTTSGSSFYPAAMLDGTVDLNAQFVRPLVLK